MTPPTSEMTARYVLQKRRTLIWTIKWRDVSLYY
jgi:hypothetical protein